MTGEPDILRGWKEIERYLRMGRKAILRAGYPVRRENSPGTRRPGVFAVRQEILAHALRKNHITITGTA